MSDIKRAKSDPAAEPSFEKSLERLEAIVAGMESGELDLDTMIREFEEGQKLITLCQARLTEVERRVEALVKSADGTVTTTPFAEEQA
jgi:exodeoxyribonuclease VII small subunit